MVAWRTISQLIINPRGRWPASGTSYRGDMRIVATSDDHWNTFFWGKISPTWLFFCVIVERESRNSWSKSRGEGDVGVCIISHKMLAYDSQVQLMCNIKLQLLILCFIVFSFSHLIFMALGNGSWLMAVLACSPLWKSLLHVCCTYTFGEFKITG